MMTKQLLFAVASAVCLSSSASALTFTPTQDNRRTHAGAIAGIDQDIQNDNPAVAFDVFSSDLWASASDVPDWDVFANGHASQSSSLGPASISGSGFVSADGGHGVLDGQLPSSVSAITIGPVGQFQAAGESILEIVFTIDMDAHFDIQGFIGAGTQIAEGDFGNGNSQSAGVNLFDVGNGISIFEQSVSNDEQTVATSGHIGPGTYQFTASALASVFSGMDEEDSGDAEQTHGGYASRAGFQEVSLTLTGRDKPIPEPVTASLACFGLGALVLQTSRRRRA